MTILVGGFSFRLYISRSISLSAASGFRLSVAITSTPQFSKLFKAGLPRRHWPLRKHLIVICVPPTLERTCVTTEWTVTSGGMVQFSISHRIKAGGVFMLGCQKEQSSWLQVFLVHF
eukprot:Lithocolla_globosa_v1_NODE_63_length_7262_cov_10.450950.p5 type:complete len:117 gc:universal NODE_63_length_7262_cov_10.450950:791-441(-)